MLRKGLFVLLLVIIVCAVGYAILQSRDSAVPEEARRALNPLQPTYAILKSAEHIYLEKCTECHGDQGRGDGRQASMYQPKPTNFTDLHHMNTVTDGELFYRITQGRKPMPAYKHKLTDEQRWGLVLLVRAFGQPAALDKRSNPVPAEAPQKK